MGTPLDGLSLAQTAGVVAAFFVGVTVVASLTGFAMERALPKRRVFAVPLFAGQYHFELTGNALYLALIVATVTAALRTGAIRFGETSLARDLVTFQAMVLGFQVFYWFLHRAMHTHALVWMHRWHHRSQVTTPLTGLSMHPAEALGWMVGLVALPALASRVVPVGFWGLVGYYAFNMLGNIVGHANVEPTARFAATRNATWFANAFVYHAMHHARWNGHYAFQAALMDRLMGTEWSDWPALYERVASGRPLTSLQEKG